MYVCVRVCNFLPCPLFTLENLIQFSHDQLSVWFLFLSFFPLRIQSSDYCCSFRLLCVYSYINFTDIRSLNLINASYCFIGSMLQTDVRGF